MCSKNKGADQLRSYCQADLRHCFCLCRLLVFPCGSSFIYVQLTEQIYHAREILFSGFPSKVAYKTARCSNFQILVDFTFYVLLNSQGHMHLGFKSRWKDEKPRIESMTPYLQGQQLHHYVTETSYFRYEPPLTRENQQFAYAKPKAQISAFVFATRIVQFLLNLTPTFQASSSFLCSYRPVCVGPVRKPHCWFSHETAHI